MKILFSSRPAYGHVYPLLPLALAARDAGHDVTFATAGTFLETVARLGLPVRPVGIPIEAAIGELTASLAAEPDGMPKDENGRPDLEMGGRLFLDIVGHATVADLIPLLPAIAPDLVIYEQYDLGAGVAAHAAGIPAVCHALSPVFSPEDLTTIVGGGRMARLWAAAGVSDPAFDVFAGDHYLDIIPDAIQVPAFIDHPARARVRPVPFTEPGAAVPSWIGRTGRPLVYLTLGTVVATDDTLRPAIEGLASLDVDVLVALGSADGAALGDLPPNVHVESFVDQPAVLDAADLAVHHGGSGTVLGALLAGVPQLLLPKGADQFLNADRMAAAALASVLEPRQASTVSVAAAAARLLDGTSSTYDAARAEAVRKELLALPSPAEVAADLAARFSPVTV